MKRCAKCKAEKRLSEFHRVNGNPHSYCKECVRAQMRAYSEKNRARPAFDLPERKVCSNCKTDKPRSDFNLGRGRKDGLQTFCVSCMSEKQRLKRMALEPGERHLHDKRKHLKSIFGITLERYDHLHLAQGGVCAICLKVNSDGRKLAVDHEHGTGKIRGLLCHHCNRGLGVFKDSLENLVRAVAYLKSHQ